MMNDYCSRTDSSQIEPVDVLYSIKVCYVCHYAAFQFKICDPVRQVKV